MKKTLLALGMIAVLISILAAPAQARETVRVIVTFTTPPTANDAALVTGMGGSVRHVYSIIPGMAILLPETAIPGLSRNPRVASIEPDTEAQASEDTELGNSWGVDRIGAGLAHAAGNKGAGVKIAILDTGIDPDHEDLDANYAGGKNFVDPTSDPIDDHGHGTHVAGIIAAEDNEAGVVGVAPLASIYALKVLDAEGSGYFGDIIAALDWAVAEGMQVANLSLGSAKDPGTAVETAFANAEAAGLLIVAAAGNSGNAGGGGNKVEYPARYASVIAVAATDASDLRASFSSTGETVELAAPGVGVNSTLPGGTYDTKSGTSMAAPHVAGTAALVIAVLPDGSDSNGNGRTNDEVRQILTGTADDLGAVGRDPWYGWGLVDADEAGTPQGPVNAAPAVTITSPTGGARFDSGSFVSFSGTALDPEDGDLTASLAWVSSIDGFLGAGGSFDAVLSDGQHVITASVTDSGGREGSSTVSILVGTVPTLSVTVVTDKASYVNRETVLITVTVTDGVNPVEGAAVHMVLRTASGRVLTADGITNSQGVALFTHKILSRRDGVGTYNADATAEKSGYDGGAGSTTFEVTS
jgi:subtilisin family serine protease